MLENFFISEHAPIDRLEKPLGGLVLHFGEGGLASQPCEAAYLALPSVQDVKGPRVTIFVSKSSVKTMKHVYKPLGQHATVQPLLFDQSELDAEAFLAMMAVGSSDGAPLYMQIILVRV